jgi:sugar fermentation stimulation protein A
MNTPGMPVWLSYSDNPKRKLAYTLELVEADGALIGVNTMLPNRLVAEALAAGAIPELAGYPIVRPEVKYGDASRVDFLLQGEGTPDCFVEVKGVTLHRGGGLAEFPDCVSARALRHLIELEREIAAGNRGVLLFVIQRMDCTAIEAAADLDPAYAAGLIAAARAGVEVLCYDCHLSANGVRLAKAIPWNRRAPIGGPRRSRFTRPRISRACARPASWRPNAWTCSRRTSFPAW